jgi:hypothetical protein
MGYWILFVVVCWIGFGVLTPSSVPADLRRAAFNSAAGALLVFAFIESFIKSHQQKKWTRRVAYAPARRDVPLVKLSDSLMVEDHLRAFVSGIGDDEESGKDTAVGPEIKRIYEALDE